MKTPSLATYTHYMIIFNIVTENFTSQRYGLPSDCLTFYNIETATHTRTHVHIHHTAALDLDQETGVHGERREKEREEGPSEWRGG